MLEWLLIKIYLRTNLASLPVVGALGHAAVRGEVDDLATLVGGLNSMVNRAAAT